MHRVTKEILIAPMSPAEAARRVQYTTKGSTYHRALMGIVAARTIFQPELDIARIAEATALLRLHEYKRCCWVLMAVTAAELGIIVVLALYVYVR